MDRASAVLAAALGTVVASLLIVGVVSDTQLRHAIQVLPVVALLGLGLARRRWTRFAAMAVLAFWLFIMVLIWLYLLEIARVISGHFSRTEVALTIVIGVATLTGIAASFRVRDSSAWPARVASFIAGAALQIALMWLSLQPTFANR